MLLRSRRRPATAAVRTREKQQRDVQLPDAQGTGMSDAKSRVLICSCEKSMSLDPQAVGRACAAHVTHANQLCGAELDFVKTALAGSERITITCTQEAPLFSEIAEDLGKPEPIF